MRKLISAAVVAVALVVGLGWTSAAVAAPTGPVAASYTDVASRVLWLDEIGNEKNPYDPAADIRLAISVRGFSDGTVDVSSRATRQGSDYRVGNIQVANVRLKDSAGTTRKGRRVCRTRPSRGSTRRTTSTRRTSAPCRGAATSTAPSSCLGGTTRPAPARTAS